MKKSLLSTIFLTSCAVMSAQDLKLNELEYFVYNKPFDIAAKCINEVNNKLLMKEPKIITKKIISTKFSKN